MLMYKTIDVDGDIIIIDKVWKSLNLKRSVALYY